MGSPSDHLSLMDLWDALTFLIIIGCYITVIVTFGRAFLDPTESTLVTINEYGEKWVELILFMVTLPRVFDIIRRLIVKTFPKSN